MGLLGPFWSIADCKAAGISFKDHVETFAGDMSHAISNQIINDDRLAAYYKSGGKIVSARKSGRSSPISPAIKTGEQLAVLSLKAQYGVDKGLAEAVSVEIRNEIHRTSKYEVLSMEDLEAIAERTKTQQFLGCDDNFCLLDFGKKIGTRFMVAGSLSKLGGIYSVSLRLLDTEGKTAGVKKRVSKKCNNEAELFDTSKAVANMLFEK